MPVIGTPVLFASGPAPGSSLITLNPSITQIYKATVPGKMRGIAVRANQLAAINLTLLDDAANPVDLTTFGFPLSVPDDTHTIQVQLAEAITRDPGNRVAGTVVNAQFGQVNFILPQNILANPAVYLCEVGAMNGSGLIFSNTFYVMIQRGLFPVTGSTGCTNASFIPTLDEIRLALRDTPEGNLLLGNYEFDIAEVCESLVRAVMEWNSAAPILDYIYSTANFPYRLPWLQGADVYLLETAATWFQRNQLTYQAGGLAIDDLNKAQPYLSVVERKRQWWTDFVRKSKVQANMAAGFATFGSAYGWDQNW